MLRCRSCLREVPARALPRRRPRWRERLLLTVALAIPASLAVAVAVGFPDPDAGSPPLRLRVDGELIRAQVDTWQHGQMLCARLERDWPVELRDMDRLPVVLPDRSPTTVCWRPPTPQEPPR
jgi:hypothetical protein